METTLTIEDRATFELGGRGYTFVLALPAERLTVRELIRARVFQEVQAYNERCSRSFWGLVQPTEAECTLNGYRLPRQRRLDAEKQCQRAIEAFQRNGFLILVDDRQVSDLDEEIEVTPATRVTFLKLVPLVGG
jgi:hypothetical protein